MTKTITPEHYYFATARMIEQAQYKSTGIFQTIPSGKDNPFNAVIMDCIREAMETAKAPIYIPRTACNLFMSIW